VGGYSGCPRRGCGDSMIRTSACRRYLITCVAVVSALGSAALAQSHARATAGAVPVKLGESLSGQAREDYESGRVLFENHDFAGALVKFQHAFDLSSDVRLLWNMGACEKNLRHYVRVHGLVERFLREGGSRITGAQRDEAEAVLRTIRPLIGEIRVNVNEAGASVFVDDELVGATPIREPLRIDLGDRRVRVSKPGFKDQVVAQHVAGGSEATLTVALDREVSEGRLLVATDPAGAIEIDGRTVGLGRWQGAVPPGSHALRITAPGMRPYSSDLLLREAESRTVDVTLQRESAGISPAWWIGGSIVAAAGLGVGGYFLLRPSSSTAQPTPGTINPYMIVVQSTH